MNAEQRYSAAEMERVMKLQDVLLKAMAKKMVLVQTQADGEIGQAPPR